MPTTDIGGDPFPPIQRNRVFLRYSGACGAFQVSSLEVPAIMVSVWGRGSPLWTPYFIENRSSRSQSSPSVCLSSHQWSVTGLALEEFWFINPSNSCSSLRHECKIKVYHCRNLHFSVRPLYAITPCLVSTWRYWKCCLRPKLLMK